MGKATGRKHVQAPPTPKGDIQTLHDKQVLAELQSRLDVLTTAQALREVEPLIPLNEGATDKQQRAHELHAEEAYGVERREYAPVGVGRRNFRLQHLDRLHRNGKLTEAQYMAGVWYREQYERGRYDAPKTMDLQRTRGGNIVQIESRDWQQDARDRWRASRHEWPTNMLGFMEAFLLRDTYPKRHHRAAMRQLSDIRRALEQMANYLRIRS